MAERSRLAVSKTTSNPKTNAKPYKPAIGRDFGVEEITAKDQYETSRTRDKIALIFVLCAILALGGAALHGWTAGNFDSLGYVWAIVGPFAGAIGSYYFHRDRKDSG